MLRTLLALALLAAATLAGDILVIAPEGLQSGIGKWRAHRVAEGHEVVVETPGPDLRAQVKAAHQRSGGALRFVVLVGDTKKVACAYHPGKVIQPYERDPQIANDNHLADLDGDGLPELAVGRIPADNAEEAAAMLGKVVAYEKSKDFGAWRRRINVIAGVGGFGKWQDWALEQVATKFLTESVPAAYDLHVTYGNVNSPFCPPPSEAYETTLERFNEGALLVAYLGHGSRLKLDRLHFGTVSYRFLDEEDVYELESRRGAPIGVLVACSTGHFDGAPDCLAELALKQPRGPVAMIAASRVSMPYANGVFAKELLDAMFLDRAATVGEVVALAKRRLMKPREGDEGRQFIETLAMGYQWRPEKRAEERAEHLYLYNLLGDPSMRIPHAQTLAIACAETADPGDRLDVRIEASFAGRVLCELVEKRKSAVPKRGGDDPASFRAAYERANDWTRARAEAEGAELTLALPDDLAPGAYFVRAWVVGKEGAAMGARPLTVRKPKAAPGSDGSRPGR